MKLTNASDRIHAAGAEVIAIVVDSDERNAAMISRWSTSNVKYVSDPGGELYLKSLDLFDPNERDGIARPGLFVIDPDGNEVFGYRGNDFADRRNDDDALDALEALGLSSIEAPAGGPVVADVDVDQKGAFTPKSYVPYFMGNKFGALAIKLRAEGDEAKQLAGEHEQMADSMVAAWRELNG